MFKTLAVMVVLVSLSAAGAGLETRLVAQDKKAVTVADFVGTWSVEMMSHQVALVIEPAEGNKVTATMMMMGNDVLLKGELVERTLTLVGVKSEASAAGGSAAPHSGAIEAAGQKPGAKPITAVLQDDGTLAGEMMTNMGPAKWTGEKLKKKP